MCLTFRISRYGVNLVFTKRLPSGLPFVLHVQEGFPDIAGFSLLLTKQWGKFDTYPTRNFATLGPFTLLLHTDVAGQILFGSPCRHGGRTISSIGFLMMVWRVVSEDSITKLNQFACDSGIVIADLLTLLWPFLLIVCTGQIFTSN